MTISLFGIEPLTPAHGRDYTSEAALLADFNANKDFLTPRGQYTSKDDLAGMGVTSINARYKKSTECVVLVVSP